MSKKWGIEEHEKIIAESNRCIELLRSFKIGEIYNLCCGSTRTPDQYVVVEVRDMHSNQINVNVLAMEKENALRAGRANKKKGTFAAIIPLDQIKNIEVLNKEMAPLMINYEFMSNEIKELMFNKD